MLISSECNNGYGSGYGNEKAKATKSNNKFNKPKKTSYGLKNTKNVN